MTQLPDDVAALAAKVSNWGRWGTDDEVGTLNHITPEKLVRAATLVRTGKTFSLAIPLDQKGPQAGPIRVNPIHTMTATGCDDVPPLEMGAGARYTDDVMFLYLQSSTQWDSLAHMYYGDQLYNGFSARSIDSSGAHRVGIDKTCNAYVSRGVLLDLPRWRGVDCIDPADAIRGDDLDDVAAKQGVVIEAGDIILLRTGLMWTWLATGNWSAFQTAQPGLHYSTVEWLYDNHIAAIAGDNGAVEQTRSKHEPDLTVFLHMLGLRDMGICLGELWYFEDLAADCADDGVYDCFLAAQALPITGAVGSPVNPIAMK